MREQAAHLTRRAAAAFPLAALIRPASATHVAPSSGSADGMLLDLGRRWAAAWDAQVAHDRSYSSRMSEADAVTHDQVGDQLFADEHALFDAIMAVPAKSVAGLAIKAQVLARTHDVEERGVEAVEAAAAGVRELTTCAALSLVADVLRLARIAA